MFFRPRSFYRWPISLYFLVACSSSEAPPSPPAPPPTIAEDVFAPLGEIRPSASESQREDFARGERLAARQWTSAEGLGPLMNVTFCGACHEKPVFGGSAGHYRDFYIQGERLGDGAFIPSGPKSGVWTGFQVGEAEQVSRITPAPEANALALRNPIPFFGIGLLAEIPETEILGFADPEDEDGDGISGRPNYDQGYVGRFGLKSQTVSVENFIRGPLFNHMGLTSNPLSPERQAALPVPSVARDAETRGEVETRQDPLHGAALEVQRFHQAAAPSEPLYDDDESPDPEVSEDELFDLVSWAMLLAAPAPSPMSDEARAGETHFEALLCDRCHRPTLLGPRGLIPAYTDLLLHDMGPELADGISVGLATGSEFRSAPLWGVSAIGPYLHDGRAHTLAEAIIWHGGEGAESSARFQALSTQEQGELVAFLKTLGGAEQASAGLLPPDAPRPPVGELPGPLTDLSEAEWSDFIEGQRLFDHDFGFSEGLGPSFNGDSCRGCHFEPKIGGAGPVGVSAVRAGVWEGEVFTPIGDPETFLPRFGAPGWIPAHGGGEGATFEIRQALPVYGLGIIEAISEEAILAGEDPEDLDGDGVRGIARRLPDGRIGRLGWRAQLATIGDFVADALSQELGLTLPNALGYPQARSSDEDEVADPELDAASFETLSRYLERLAPPRDRSDAEGRVRLEMVGCLQCHAPLGEEAGRAIYSDLLLHDVQRAEAPQGVKDGEVAAPLFRTPPLWGLGETDPYWHDGRAETIRAAIEAHGGEAAGSVERFNALSAEEQAALIETLKAL